MALGLAPIRGVKGSNGAAITKKGQGEDSPDFWKV